MTVTHGSITGSSADQDIGELLTQCPDTIYIVDGVCATGAEMKTWLDAIDILFSHQKALGVCRAYSCCGQ